MAAGGTRALDELGRAGVVHTVHEYAPHEPTGVDRGHGPAWGEDAAAALGVDPARMHKTLIASVDGRLAVAERATGYVRGGISPLGQRRRLPTVVDAAALDLPTVFVSAGRRGLQVELAPADLVRLAGAVVARIARTD